MLNLSRSVRAPRRVDTRRRSCGNGPHTAPLIALTRVPYSVPAVGVPKTAARTKAPMIYFITIRWPRASLGSPIQWCGERKFQTS